MVLKLEINLVHCCSFWLIKFLKIYLFISRNQKLLLLHLQGNAMPPNMDALGPPQLLFF